MSKANEETTAIVYNKEHYTVMANDLIKGKQNMTLAEARLIRLLITQIAQKDSELKTYTCRIADLAAFLGIDASNIYRGTQNICEKLLKQVVKISSGNPKKPWKIFHWVSAAEYDGNGNLTIRLSDEIKPYVISLNKWFTQYQFSNILSFGSFYAIRLYELLSCAEGVTRGEKASHKFEIAYLRTYFDCEKKYKTTAEFMRRVITPSCEEICKKTNYNVYARIEKTGRRITDVDFTLLPKLQLPPK